MPPMYQGLSPPDSRTTRGIGRGYTGQPPRQSAAIVRPSGSVLPTRRVDVRWRLASTSRVFVVTGCGMATNEAQRAYPAPVGVDRAALCLPQEPTGSPAVPVAGHERRECRMNHARRGLQSQDPLAGVVTPDRPEPGLYPDDYTHWRFPATTPLSPVASGTAPFYEKVFPNRLPIWGTGYHLHCG